MKMKKIPGVYSGTGVFEGSPSQKEFVVYTNCCNPKDTATSDNNTENIIIDFIIIFQIFKLFTV